MLKKTALLSAAVLGGALVFSPLVSAQNAPKTDKDKPNAGKKDAPRETRKPMQPGAGAQDRAKDKAKDARDDKPRDDKPREARKPVQPDRAKDTAKDTAKDARDTAKDTAKDARENAKDSKDTAKKDAKDTRGTAKDTAKDARKDKPTAKDTAKDKPTAKDKDSAKDSSTAKDSAKDSRDPKATADSKKDSDAKASKKFDPKNVKADDIGLSVKESSSEGLTVSSVQENSPIARVGFRQGDRIVSVNGQRISRQADFFTYLFADDVRNDRVKVIVYRDGVEKVVYVEPTVIIREYETVVVDDDRNIIRDFGLVLDDRYEDEVVVRKVFEDSPADRAGVREEDAILAVNEQRVDNRQDLRRLLEKFEGDKLELEVSRQKQAKVVEVEFVR